MSKVTDYIMSKTKLLQISPEISKSNPRKYQQFNSGGVEVEVGELLHSLIRVLKPEIIVETGTHLGISSVYMALALEENQQGKLITYEVIESLRQTAIALWKDIEVEHRIKSNLQPSLLTSQSPPIDFLFLDSEPQYRFDEFKLYWQWLNPGGWIAIHDLNHQLGHTNQIINKMYDWPYGDFREKLGPFIKEHKVQTVCLPTIRGITFFQKEDRGFAHTKHIRGDL